MDESIKIFIVYSRCSPLAYTSAGLFIPSEQELHKSMYFVYVVDRYFVCHLWAFEFARHQTQSYEV